MAYRNKTYIAFDGDTDMAYYRTLQMWKSNDDIDFDFYDAHDLNTSKDTSLTESIKSQLRIRFDNSKLFMILVGENTKWNCKFIPWEIGQALNRKLPIIVVNINELRQKDGSRCPTTLRDVLAIHIPFKAAIIQYALSIGHHRTIPINQKVIQGHTSIRMKCIKDLGCEVDNESAVFR